MAFNSRLVALLLPALIASLPTLVIAQTVPTKAAASLEFFEKKSARSWPTTASTAIRLTRILKVGCESMIATGCSPEEIGEQPSFRAIPKRVC